MDPKQLSIVDYTYDLPAERIARYPLPERDSSKLLIYKNGIIREDIYRNIANHLPAPSLLIANDTKVIEARIVFQKPTGGQIEIFCLEPHEQYPDITTGMMQRSSVLWICLIGGASKWKHGQVLEKSIHISDEKVIVSATFKAKTTSAFVVEFSWEPSHFTFAEILHAIGAIPLPPYIKREVESSDAERYQTVYADSEGSVAAPTAGLHFTEQIFDSLDKNEISVDYVTLHVGAGTFQPVKSRVMEGHIMHAEFIDIGISTIELLINNIDKPLTALGTTSLRTLESIYWMGVKCTLNPNISHDSLAIQQWEPYSLHEYSVPKMESFTSLVRWMNKNQLTRLVIKTGILIAPGYEIKTADVLITNFHQPQSTLLLLVAAFVGDDWRKIYDYAMENDFRFLSYGDGCLLFRNQPFFQERNFKSEG